jgi:predicted lipoprotein with Yx(FWY)xxD motif
VGVGNTGLGNVLVNSAGMTLYMFAKDTGTQSTCTGACAQNWPPLLDNGKPTAGSGATASMLGTTTRSDGGSQVTYNGHPLYLFAGDNAPGDTNGQGLTAFGGSWFALSPAGNQVSGQASNSGGGLGYEPTRCGLSRGAVGRKGGRALRAAGKRTPTASASWARRDN